MHAGWTLEDQPHKHFCGRVLGLSNCIVCVLHPEFIEKMTLKLAICSIMSSVCTVSCWWHKLYIDTTHCRICFLARWQIFERLLNDLGHHLIPHFNWLIKWWTVHKLLIL